MAEKFAAYNAHGGIVAFYDSIDSPVPEGVAAVQISQEQWERCLSEPGWTVVHGALVAPPIPTPQEALESAREALKTEAAAKRWEVETGGITLASGMRVGTTKADQDRITSVVAHADLAGVTTLDFKSASGWVTLSVDDLKNVAAAVALHVQACFSAERQHHDAIDLLATVSATRSYDLSVGWPLQSPAMPSEA